MNLYMLAAISLGGALIYLLFHITTLALRIDKRSHPEKYQPGREPARLSIPAIMVNWKIARDADTQNMRKRMNFLLFLVLAGCVVIGLLVSQAVR